MNKLDSRSSTLLFSEDTTSPCNDVPAHRLIVLIPADSDYTFATRRIADLARTSDAHVLFLGLCKDAGQELSLRRQLITLSALLQDARVCAESKVEIGMNSVDIVKSNYRDGDMIVCFAEQRTGLWQRSFSQILESNLQATLFVISNPTPLRSEPNLFSQVGSWLGFISIILGFGILQTKVVQLPGSSLPNILLILSIVPEFWLIWVWNSLFG